MSDLRPAGLLRLMTYNVLEGGVEGECGDRWPLACEVIASQRPDLLVICEARGLDDPRSPRRLQLRDELGLEGAVASATSDHPVAVLARLPLRLEQAEPVTVARHPRIRAWLEHPALGRVRLVAAHLDYQDPEVREQEVAALLEDFEPGAPALLMGDLNALSHEDGLTRRALRAFSSKHRARHSLPSGEPACSATLLLARAGLVDAWVEAGDRVADPGGFTVPTDIPSPPSFPRARLDYIFLSADLAERLVRCEVVRRPPAGAASDHHPLVAELRT